MRIERNNAKKTVYIEAESITEMVEHASRWNQQPQAQQAPIRWEMGDWIGHHNLKNWKDVRTAVSTPWATGMTALTKLQSALGHMELPTPTDRRRRRTFNEEAGEVEIDRVMSGQLDCFSAPKRRDVRQPKTLRLNIPFTFSAGVSAEEIMWKAVAAIAISDILENSGRPVEICMMFLTSDTYQSGAPIYTTGFVATLKQANDPLNIGALVSALSPWFFRTVCFGMQDSQSDCKTCSSRGRPDNSPEGLGRMTEALGIPDNTESITMSWVDSASSAEAFIRSTVQQMEEAE